MSTANPEATVPAEHPTLWAVADLHINAPGNRELVDQLLRPRHEDDWLIVAGDIAENLDTVADTLDLLASRYCRVIYTPGNHELYSRSSERHRGRQRYEILIRRCQDLGVLTPEDPFDRFAGHTIVPMFTLYDHSWRTPDTPESMTIAETLDVALADGIVLTDHFAIAPFVDIPQWCRDRLRYTVQRLSEVTGPTVLVNHWPLVREAMDGVAVQQIGLWSGTRHTQRWARRYNARAVIYGHLHIPRRLTVDGIEHVEVSLGYRREIERTLAPRVERGLWPYPVLVDGVDASSLDTRYTAPVQQPKSR